MTEKKTCYIVVIHKHTKDQKEVEYLVKCENENEVAELFLSIDKDVYDIVIVKKEEVPEFLNHNVFCKTDKNLETGLKEEVKNVNN